uniref:CHASE domain-containing protein n=1 Tax=Tanacetum cinerariifolium TaxID=118510 RepID=A0A699GMM3_TANCI|nr:hypothetical protein [Tanacetum cinerariifolium]
MASSAARQGQRERAALAEIAFEEQRAADQVGQVLAQVQSQARPFRVAGGGGIELRERLEQLVLVFLADAGAAVGHREFDDLLTLALALRERDTYRAGLGELDGVVAKVEQDLGQRALVRVEHDGLVGQVHFELEVFLHRQWPQGVHHFAHHVLALHRLHFERDLAGLDLGHVEDVVNQREQVARAGADGVELLVLLRGERAGKLHQQRARKADDGVERRAQLVRHVGDEGGLHAARFGQFQVFQRDFAVDGFQLAGVVGQAHIEFDDLPFARLQFAVDLHRLFVGGDQQVEDLLALGVDEVLLFAQVQGDADFHVLVAAQLLVHQHVADAVEQIIFRIRLADKIVGAAFDAADDVLGVHQRGAACSRGSLRAPGGHCRPRAHDSASTGSAGADARPGWDCLRRSVFRLHRAVSRNRCPQATLLIAGFFWCDYSGFSPSQGFFLALEAPGAPREDQRIAVAVRVQRLDRRRFVDHGGVVEQQHGPRFGHGETLAVGAFGFEYAGLAALDQFARDQDHGHEIDAVAVRAFRRGTADAVGGVDAELVRFHVPRRVATVPGRAAYLADGRDQRRPRRLRHGGRQHRLEQAVHAAVQGVILERLPVRAVRRLRELRALLHEARMAAAPVAATVLEVQVRLQRVPAGDQGVERVQRHAGQRGHVLRGKQRIAFVAQRAGAQLVELLLHAHHVVQRAARGLQNRRRQLRRLRAQGVAVRGQLDDHLAFVDGGAGAGKQFGLLHALEQRCERGRIEEQPFAHFGHGLFVFFPQHQHHQVLGIGEPQPAQQLAINFAHRQRRRIQRKTQLAVEQRRGSRAGCGGARVCGVGGGSFGVHGLIMGSALYNCKRWPVNCRLRRCMMRHMLPIANFGVFPRSAGPVRGAPGQQRPRRADGHGAHPASRPGGARRRAARHRRLHRVPAAQVHARHGRHPADLFTVRTRRGARHLRGRGRHHSQAIRGRGAARARGHPPAAAPLARTAQAAAQPARTRGGGGHGRIEPDARRHDLGARLAGRNARIRNRQPPAPRAALRGGAGAPAAGPRPLCRGAERRQHQVAVQGRAAARHRQGVDPRRHPAQAGAFDAGRILGHENAHGVRPRRHRQRGKPPGLHQHVPALRARDHVLAPGKVRRHRLPRRAQGRHYPHGCAPDGGGRRVRRPDFQARVQARLYPRNRDGNDTPVQRRAFRPGRGGRHAGGRRGVPRHRRALCRPCAGCGTWFRSAVVDAPLAHARARHPRLCRRHLPDVRDLLAHLDRPVGPCAGRLPARHGPHRARYRGAAANLFRHAPQRQGDAIQFVRAVPAAQLGAYAASVRADASVAADGYPGFRIHPVTHAPVHYIIEYNEPHQGNENAFGLDLAALPLHLRAIEMCRDSGEIVATEPLTLVQDASGEPGFVARAPLYRHGVTLDTAAQRREALVGFVAIVFRANALMREVIDGALLEHLRVRIEDGGYVNGAMTVRADTDLLLYDSAGKAGAPPRNAEPAALVAEKILEVGQRRWVLRFEGRDGARYGDAWALVLPEGARTGQDWSGSAIPLAQQRQHGHIQFPCVGHRGARVGQRLRVRHGTEFRRERQHVVAGGAAQAHHLVPPRQVRGQRGLRLGRAEVGHLRALFMTHARMDVAHPGQGFGQRVRLVGQQRLARAAPVRQVGRQQQVGQLAQVGQGQRRMRAPAAAVGLVVDRHAVLARDVLRQFQQFAVLRRRKIILARLRVDVNRARGARVVQPFGQCGAVAGEVRRQRGFPLARDQPQTGGGDAAGPVVALRRVQRQRHLDAVEASRFHAVDEDAFVALDPVTRRVGGGAVGHMQGVRVARDGRAIRCAVVGQQAVEDHQAPGLAFERDGRAVVGPAHVAQFFHAHLVAVAQEAFAHRAAVTARFGPHAAVIERGVFQREPERGHAHRVGVEIGGVLVPAYFAADAGLFKNVHRLPDLGVHQADVARDGVQALVGREGAERGVQVVHGVADLVDRQRLVLFQLAVRAERFFLEEAAYRVVRAEKIIVGGLFLFDGAEDARLRGGIEIVDNLRRARTQGRDLGGAFKIGQHEVTIALVLLFLRVCQHDRLRKDGERAIVCRAALGRHQQRVDTLSPQWRQSPHGSIARNGDFCRGGAPAQLQRGGPPAGTDARHGQQACPATGRAPAGAPAAPVHARGESHRRGPSVPGTVRRRRGAGARGGARGGQRGRRTGRSAADPGAVQLWQRMAGRRRGALQSAASAAGAVAARGRCAARPDRTRFRSDHPRGRHPGRACAGDPPAGAMPRGAVRQSRLPGAPRHAADTGRPAGAPLPAFQPPHRRHRVAFHAGRRARAGHRVPHDISGVARLARRRAGAGAGRLGAAAQLPVRAVSGQPATVAQGTGADRLPGGGIPAGAAVGPRAAGGRPADVTGDQTRQAPSPYTRRSSRYTPSVDAAHAFIGADIVHHAGARECPVHAEAQFAQPDLSLVGADDGQHIVECRRAVFRARHAPLVDDDGDRRGRLVDVERGVAKDEDARPPVHRFQVARFRKDFAQRELAAHVVHARVVADIELGPFERRTEDQARAVAAVHRPVAGAVDQRLQGVAHAAIVGGIVGQRVDVMQPLVAGHARQVHVLDHLQSPLEQLDTDAERLEPEAGGLDQHHQVAGGQARKGGQHVVGRHGIEVDEPGVRHHAAIRFSQRQIEVAAGVVHDQRGVRRRVFDGQGQRVAHVALGRVHGGIGKGAEARGVGEGGRHAGGQGDR